MSALREVAVVSYAAMKPVRRESERNETEMLMPLVADAIARSGIAKERIGFYCSGTCDYLGGIPFVFVHTLDAIGAWPPVSESHVEMDGAWAFYEAWVKLQTGQVDAALVFAAGKTSGDLGDVLAAQLDPYYLAPLGADPVSLAALQARALLDAGKSSEHDFAKVAARSRHSAKGHPRAQLSGDFDLEELLASPYVASPLRKHDCPPISDGAAAMVIAAGDVARKATARPAWISGIDHRIEAHAPGLRDLTQSPSTKRAAEEAGVGRGRIDLAELHAPFSHQELILREALDLDENVAINPSGGALAGNPMMVAGLMRIGEAAQAILDEKARRALAHATSGPCLQQNLVCVLEAGKEAV